MREIKFRSYNPRDMKMHYDITGFECDCQGDFTGVFIDGAFFLKEEVYLMQYTGLHDKNGKEIYESDVVEITRQCIFERGLVIFKNGCFFIKVKETLLPLYECEINKFELKVIGNKFDNPELLEKGKE